MSGNQQLNQKKGSTGDDIPGGQTRKFKYKRRSPFPLLLRIAEHELDSIDAFFDLAKETWRPKHNLDDWLVDEVAELEDLALLSEEFAIVGLWRCVELYRKRAMRIALSKDAARRAFKHEEFQKDLLQLQIDETKISCARSMNELRCLNNGIKHERRVDDELAEFPKWKKKKGKKLVGLERHYRRLHHLTKRYLEDLTRLLKNAKLSSLGSTVKQQPPSSRTSRFSRGQATKLKSQNRTVLPLLLRIAEYRLNNIDSFFDLAKKAWMSERKSLEEIASISGETFPDDDRWVDDFAELDELVLLSAEFAIIGLWRCIELYRKSTMRATLENEDTQHPFKYTYEEFKEYLLCLKIEGTKIHRAEFVNELRCLNNAIKHERQIDNKLAKFSLWQDKEGDELGDLESHYYRLRPFAKQYLEDLTERLINAKIPSVSPAGQVSKT